MSNETSKSREEKQHKPKAAEWKKKVVEELAKLIGEYPIIGAVNMENLPTRQLQNMRAQLRGHVVLKVAKRRLIKLAIEQSKKKGLEKLEEHLIGMPALLFTNENPFGLFKKVKANKSTAPAKPGQTAPKDIVVPAGPTPFAPGPIIGELGSYKIKTAIENGKIVIKEDAVVAKKGDTISQGLASILSRLGIEPMEIGLDITAVYENGVIFTKEVLDIDEEEYINNIGAAATESLKLALSIAYTTKETTEILLKEAQRDAVALAIGISEPAKEIIDMLLLKANAQAVALKSKV